MAAGDTAVVLQAPMRRGEDYALRFDGAELAIADAGALPRSAPRECRRY